MACDLMDLQDCLSNLSQTQTRRAWGRCCNSYLYDWLVGVSKFRTRSSQQPRSCRALEMSGGAEKFLDRYEYSRPPTQGMPFSVLHPLSCFFSCCTMSCCGDGNNYSDNETDTLISWQATLTMWNLGIGKVCTATFAGKKRCWQRCLA